MAPLEIFFQWGDMGPIDLHGKTHYAPPPNWWGDMGFQISAFFRLINFNIFVLT